MRIRTLLWGSYLVVVLAALGLMAVLLKAALEDVGEANLQAGEEAVQGVVQANYQISEKVLSRLGEEVVELKALALARELSLMLAGQDELEYKVMRQDPLLRRIATQDVMASAGKAGYLALLDSGGEAVLHPDPEVEGRNFSQWAQLYPEMHAMVRAAASQDLVKGYYAFRDLGGYKRQKYMVLARVPGTRLVAAATVFIDQFFLPVHNQIRMAGQRMLSQGRKSMQEVAASSQARVRQIVLLGLTAALVAGLVCGLWFAGRLARPIMQLKRAVRGLGQGNFQESVPEDGPNEIKALGQSFNELGGRLAEYMERLRQETEARMAVMSEVRIARQIQESLLPRVFPAFPERKEFSLFADNLAAQEVAGDFYDFFFMEDQRLALIIGDVSGKGIPAALFMAVTRTLLRNICPQQPDPARALANANEVLCLDNEAAMFVTVFLVYYDLASGRLEYANAGHNLPYLVGPGQEAAMFGRQGDVPLGVLPGEKYTRGELVLAPEQTMVLYTDGITEAQDQGGELFGEPRLEALLAQGRGLPVAELCAGVTKAVESFQNGLLFDDVTILALRHHGPQADAGPVTIS